MTRLGVAVDLRRDPTITIRRINADTGEQRDITAPFPRSFIEAMVDRLGEPHRKDSVPTTPLYIGFYRTLFHHFAGGAEVIEPGTPASERLLAACDRAGPDIRQLPRELLAAAPEATVRGPAARRGTPPGP